MKTIINLRASITRLVQYATHPFDPVVRYHDTPHFKVRLYLIKHPHRRRLTESFGLN